MTNPLHRFFWEDSEFRRWVYALTAIAGTLYATARTLVFHRPERQVAVELFVVVLVLNSAAVALNYLTTRESTLEFFGNRDYAKATDKGRLTEYRRLVFASLVAAALVTGATFFPSYLTYPEPGPSIITMSYLQIVITVMVFVLSLLSMLELNLMIHSSREATGPLRTHRFSLKVGGVVACLILLSAPRLSVSKVQAAIVNQRLESAASSVEPDKAPTLSSNELETRFQKIASIASTSTQYKIPANPGLVEKVKNNLKETLKSVNTGGDVRRSGVSAFIKLVAYARFNNVLIAVNAPTVLLPHSETGNYMLSQVPLRDGTIWWQGSAEGSTIFGMPEPSTEPVFPVSHSSVIFNAVNFNAFGMRRAFVGTDNESQVVVMNATIEGATQKLDAIVWLNVKFKNSQIIYSGGPLYLGDVTFENCQFQFGNDPESQKVLAQIKASENQSVTLVSGL
jgi:hypothetical protein